MDTKGNDKQMPVTLTFVLLACARTFGKLKYFRGRCHELKQGFVGETTVHSYWLGTGDCCDQHATMVEEDVKSYARFLFETSQGFISGQIQSSQYVNHGNYRCLSPKNACRIVEAELNLIYYKFYGGVVPSIYELLIITLLLSIEFSFSPIFIASIFVNNYGILYAILLIMSAFKFSLITAVKEIQVPLLSTALLPLPPLSKSLYTSSSLDFSNIPIYILLITHYLVAYPIMKTHYFPHIYRNDHNQWPWWSRTIPQFNLLKYSLRKPSKLSAFLSCMLNTWPLSGKKQYSDEIGAFTFRELRDIILNSSNDDTQSNNHRTNTTQITAAKGTRVLEQNNRQGFIDCEASFEERAILWHVATEILYLGCSTDAHDEESTTDNRYMSKIFSDYMGYLLVVQPSIMSKRRGYVLQKCLELWSEVNGLIKNKGVEDYPTQQMQLKSISEIITSQLQEIKDDHQKTMLDNACVLVTALIQKFQDEKEMWCLIVRVWVEMLAFTAARRCNAMDHINGLSQGGEFASIIWLWMFHLGFLEDCEGALHSTSTKENLAKSGSKHCNQSANASNKYCLHDDQSIVEKMQ